VEETWATTNAVAMVSSASSCDAAAGKVKTQNRISALGLDVGKKRIGVAGCDGTGLIATGLTTIERTSFERDLAQLRHLVQQRQVQVLVVGLPYTMDGALGFQARQVQKFAQRMATALQLPIEYVDERLTSVQAEQLLHAENLSPSRNKGLIDRKAAALILQQWLDERRSLNPQRSQLATQDSTRSHP
jgi:putative Holliday junction resolvase